VKDEVKRLIKKTDYIMRAVHRKKDEEVFKKEEFERFNKIFHIGLKSPVDTASNIEKKQDDLNDSKVGTK
jgi:hypothetical protein